MKILVIFVALCAGYWQLSVAHSAKPEKKVRPVVIGYVAGYKGIIRYWDEAAQAPYLFNSKEKIFISYDDEQSIKAKCQYVKQQAMGGVMFWEYSDDLKTCLLQTITKNLN